MSIEDIEMNRQRPSLDKDVNKLVDKDVNKLVDKYIKIMNWDVPDIDEPKARRLILDEIKRSISRIENQ